MFYVYVLRSLKDGKFYTGMTADLERRLEEHNRGITRSTRSRKPFIVIYKETTTNRIEARKREKYLKSGAGREFIKKHIPV
jgi:putative endonuclease